MLPETLKTRPETQYMLETEVALIKISKQLSRKYLNPNSFLTLKGKLTSLNDQEFSLSNTTRKYFGRKTRLPLNSFNTVSINNYFRYFQKVLIEEIDSEDSEGRPLTSFTITVRSLGGLGVLDQPLLANKQIARRVLAICPCEVSIVSNKKENTQWWLSMPVPIKKNIKSLEIAFSEYAELLKRPNLFKDFNSLESCCICIISNDPHGAYERSDRNPDPSVAFLSALCRIKNLKSLELDLSQAPISRETLTMLLCEIAMYEPSRWCVRAKLAGKKKKKDYPIEIKKLKTILNKLDFLGLDASDTSVSNEYRDTEVNGYEHNPTSDLSKMKRLTQKRKRILDIIFTSYSEQDLPVDVKRLLNHCTSLKGIYIRSTGPCFQVKGHFEEVIQIQDKRPDKDEMENESDKVKTWASDLEDVVFSFNTIDGNDDENLGKLVPFIQKQSSNLRSLEVFYCSSEDRFACDQVTEHDIDLGRRDDIKLGFYDLKQNISLEELRLTSNGEDIEILEPILERLSNLKKLHLVLGVGFENQDPWDSSFPFQHCTNLQELTITINPDMKTLPWGEHFIKNIHYLQNLSVLEINDQANPMTLRIFCALVKRLMDFKNLTKLIVQAKVTNPVAFQEIPEEFDEQMKENLNALFKRLKSQVKSFVHSNRNLEEFNIGKLEGWSFKHFKYA